MSQENQASRRVGERLRQIREQQGISVADAADRLHILPSYVNAMETGKYGVLPGTVFLRGYVRSYARMLQLNEDEVVAQLDRELGSNEQADTKRQATQQDKQKSKRSYVMIFLVVAAALLIGTVLHFQQQKLATTVDSETPAENESAELPVGPVDSDLSDQDKLSESRQSEVSTPGPASIPTIVSIRDSIDARVSEADTAVEENATLDEPDASSPSASISESDTGAVQAIPGVSSPGDIQSEGSSIDSGEQQPAGMDRLVVDFSGDCWFELTDAVGERKRGLFREGDRLVYEGPAPFKLVIGAASEAELVFNGEKVDYSKYRVRSNRAGLTLGQ